MWKRACIVAVVLNVSFGLTFGADDPKTAKPPTFTISKGWERLEPDKAGITTARFRSGEGQKQVVVTLTKAGGGLVANVNRWRGQIGLESLSAEEAVKTLRETKVDGLPSHLLDATGPEVEGKVTQRVVAVVVQKGEETWFARMGGPAGSVAEQKAAFDEFVKSIHFEK